MAVNFRGALTFEPSLARLLWEEDTRSIALVIGSGAPIYGFVTSALHKHDIMFCLICSLPLSKLCIQCDVEHAICLNYVLCVFSFCAGTHSCMRGHTHLLALCVYVCVCLHPGLQTLLCCDGPSSLLKFFSSLSILIECSLDRCLHSCLTSSKKTHNFPLDISFLLHSLLHVPSSGVEENPSVRKTASNRWSRNTADLPCCYTTFPPNQRSN